MDTLPEELQLQVFHFLDAEPPSTVKARHEPSLNLTKSTQQYLKPVSRVSKSWRRIVLPLLIKHACLRLDDPPRREWDDCKACGKHRGQRQCQKYHAEMAEAMNQFVAAERQTTDGHTDGKLSFSPSDNVTYRSYEFATAVWANRIYHSLEDFLSFLRLNSLASAVQSFVLVSDRMLSGKAGRFPHESGQGEWRYPASAGFWWQLLSCVKPKRIATVAPPVELACLMNASIDTFGVSNVHVVLSLMTTKIGLMFQDWAFTDMDFHILEFKIENTKSPHNLIEDFSYGELNSIPLAHPNFAETCLINLFPWTHISLNEGSFLKAYGTYEFFERGPPSLVYSIGQTLTSRNHWGKWRDGRPFTQTLKSQVRSFTYTGIFPFSNHADFRMMLPHLEELDVQFAPDPQSGILDDKSRTGKAELQDCWQELFSAYHDIAMTIGTFQMTLYHFPLLRKFVCRDVRIAALKEDLDEIFTPLCLPVWGEYEDGVFTRLAIAPPDVPVAT